MTVADADETVAERARGRRRHPSSSRWTSSTSAACRSWPTRPAPRSGSGSRGGTPAPRSSTSRSRCRGTSSTRATRDAAKPFYESIFGWQGDTAQMGDIEYTTWQLDGKPVAGMIAMSDQVPAQVPAHWLAYFAVTDADATVEKARAGGAEPLVRPDGRPCRALRGPRGPAQRRLRRDQVVIARRAFPKVYLGLRPGTSCGHAAHHRHRR